MQNKTIIYLIKLTIALILLVLGIILPFLYGEYDSIAMPLSTLIQSFGITGLPLAVFGICWLFFPKRHKLFANISLYLGSVIAIFGAFIACLAAGKLFGVLILAVWACVFIRIRKRIKQFTDQDASPFIPVSLIVIPVFILVVPLLIAAPITDWSRDRSIENAKEYIRDIEGFKLQNGYYPKALQAMHRDYSPNTIGVEKYHYLPFNQSYNLSFEQPRFLLDDLGAREWVVYNPQDEHRTYSHTAWFLSLPPERLDDAQGWFASKNTRHQHWKIFLFD